MYCCHVACWRSDRSAFGRPDIPNRGGAPRCSDLQLCGLGEAVCPRWDGFFQRETATLTMGSCSTAVGELQSAASGRKSHLPAFFSTCTLVRALFGTRSDCCASDRAVKSDHILQKGVIRAFNGGVELSLQERWHRLGTRL